MSDRFSEAVVRSWLKIGSVGLISSAVAWCAGNLIESNVLLTRDWWIIALHFAAAALRGFGMGFTFFFALILAAALLYLGLRRKKA